VYNQSWACFYVVVVNIFFEGVSIRLRIRLFDSYMPSCWGSVRFAKYLEIRSNEFFQIFRDFGGSAYDPESVKISGSDEGVLREGVGKKKV